MAFGYSTSDMVFRSKGQGHRVTECKNILKVNQVANVNYALYQVPVSNYYCYYYYCYYDDDDDDDYYYYYMLCCRQVLEVLAAVRNEDQSEIADAVYRNTCSLFNLS